MDNLLYRSSTTGLRFKNSSLSTCLVGAEWRCFVVEHLIFTSESLISGMCDVREVFALIVHKFVWLAEKKRH